MTKTSTKNTAKNTAKTKTDYIKANKLKIKYYSDNHKPCKQAVAVAVVLLADYANKPASVKAIYDAFCVYTGAYVNGKKQATKDATSNGNSIYIKHAIAGLAGNGQQWAIKTLDKIGNGKYQYDIKLAMLILATAYSDIDASKLKATINKDTSKHGKYIASALKSA